MIKIISDVWVLVEGDDDQRLLARVFYKCFKHIPRFYLYQEKKPPKVKRFVNNLHENNTSYLFFTDRDDFPSACDRRKSRVSKYGVKAENVVVVDYEIESWFAAGAEPHTFDRKKFKSEEITKEVFETLMPQQFRIVTFRNILTCFNTIKARKNSDSFNYFYQKVKKLGIGNKKENQRGNS